MSGIWEDKRKKNVNETRGANVEEEKYRAKEEV